MLNLTKQEKSVLLFIAAVVLLGITINHLQKRSRHFQEFVVSNSQAESSFKVNINKAASQDLERLPGIGPELAGRILEYRARCGGFKTNEEMKKVKGIGNKKYELLEKYLE